MTVYRPYGSERNNYANYKDIEPVFSNEANDLIKIYEEKIKNSLDNINTKLTSIKYKFDEARILEEIKQYIDSTYQQHYNLDGRQTLERSDAKGYALASCLTNCMKYTDRYELKGNPDDWRKDLVKNIHYGILALHFHDKKYTTKS